jgi:predicted transcriptional regulator
VKKKTKVSTQTAIRLDDELLEDIDKIAERLSQPKLNPITRSEVIRRFVMEGVERETKKR